MIPMSICGSPDEDMARVEGRLAGHVAGVRVGDRNPRKDRRSSYFLLFYLLHHTVCYKSSPDSAAEF